jgi:hypothetical protein
MRATRTGEEAFMDDQPTTKRVQKPRAVLLFRFTNKVKERLQSATVIKLATLGHGANSSARRADISLAQPARAGWSLQPALFRGLKGRDYFGNAALQAAKDVCGVSIPRP